MQKKSILTSTGILVLLVVLISHAALSCRTTDVEFLAKTSIIPAYSDKIPGLESPHERRQLIRDKGVVGAKKETPDSEREVLFAQLWEEYNTSPDPNMRREAVDAMTKIPYPNKAKFMKDILKDENPFIRISAIEAIGKIYNGENNELADVLINQGKIDTDKDARITAIRGLAKKTKDPDLKYKVTIALGELLQDKILVVRFASMNTLGIVTEKDYGKDINRWQTYIQNIKGETAEIPKERTWAEKLPTINLPMLK
ncbi:MAG: HEAT repeat domain-containing protein [Planctomycetaceae bacterium]|jgi:hypothetical protein|nr:HEAT repeat domain-containing protein [Planctomycetaceae bacterium]